MIKAFKQTVEQGPNIRLVVIGEGDVASYLECAFPLNSKVSFMGFVPKDKVYQLYSIADIGIVPSIHEEFGYVAVEMMMFGLPIIASDTTGLKKIVQHGVNGLSVTLDISENRISNTISDLSRKLLRLLKDEKLRKTIRKNARISFLKKYDMNVFNRNMIGFYNRLIIGGVTEKPVSE